MGENHGTGGARPRDIRAASAGVALLAAGVVADLAVQAGAAFVVVQETAVVAVAAARRRPVRAVAVAVASLAVVFLRVAAREEGSERNEKGCKIQASKSRSRFLSE